MKDIVVFSLSFFLHQKDFDQLWDLLQEEHFFTLPHRKHGLQEGVWLDRIISGLVGEMGEDRKAIVRKVCKGIIT